MWWTYFIVPCGAILHAHRERSFGWGYGHIPIFGAVVGDRRRPARRGVLPRGGVGARFVATVLTMVVPVAVYVVGIFVLYAFLTRRWTRSTWAARRLRVLLGAPLVLAAAGVGMPWCLLVLALAPWVTVVGYELRGHEHNERVLAALSEPEPQRL